jgi:hypothetical protein
MLFSLPLTFPHDSLTEFLDTSEKYSKNHVSTTFSCGPSESSAENFSISSNTAERFVEPMLFSLPLTFPHESLFRIHFVSEQHSISLFSQEISSGNPVCLQKIFFSDRTGLIVSCNIVIWVHRYKYPRSGLHHTSFISSNRQNSNFHKKFLLETGKISVMRSQ